jgi:predicted phage baseplate assembly protein
VDPESLDSARLRAAIEIRTRFRAVTAEDFEFLCGEASPRVARALCVPGEDDGAVRVFVLPRVDPADRRLAHDELVADEELLREVAGYLDERRMVGTTVQLLPAALRAVSAVVQVEVSAHSDPHRIEDDISYALYAYLNPLVGGSPHGPSTGWPFGRALNQGELYGVVQAVPGVELVRILRLYETDLRTAEQSPKPAGNVLEIGAAELIASGLHIVKAQRRAA